MASTCDALERIDAQQQFPLPIGTQTKSHIKIKADMRLRQTAPLKIRLSILFYN